MTGEILLPRPHLGQVTVMSSTARIKLLAAGRRWRKTTMGVSACLAGHKGGPGLIQGARVLWGAPTYDQARVGWDECRKASSDTATFNQSRMSVEIPGTPGRLLFRSLDNPDNARGLTADGVVIDEAAYVPEEAWEEVVRPMIMDTNGWAILMGTPNGRNWFWRAWGAYAYSTDAQVWQIPVLGCAIMDGQLIRQPHPLENGVIKFEELQRLFATMSERAFRQEILAEFIEDAGAVFRNLDVACVEVPLPAPYPDHSYAFGVDWGKSDDFTAISVWDADERKQVALDRFNIIDYVFQVHRLQAMVELWQPQIIMSESNSMGEPLIDLLASMDLPVEPYDMRAASKRTLIEEYALAIERGEAKLLNDVPQRMELEAFEVEQLPSGIYRYSAPKGLHDDMVIAGALGWNAVQLCGPAMVIV